jgi:hypothetical protein
MTTPEEIAFQADLDRLRAQVGPAALEEAQRRGVGEQMLNDALNRVMEVRQAELDELYSSRGFWSATPEPGWKVKNDDE